MFYGSEQYYSANDAQNVAEDYAQQWTNMAVVSDKISLTYGADESGVIYNLYADKLLRTNLINDSASPIRKCWSCANFVYRFTSYRLSITPLSFVRHQINLFFVLL